MAKLINVWISKRGSGLKAVFEFIWEVLLYFIPMNVNLNDLCLFHDMSKDMQNEPCGVIVLFSIIFLKVSVIVSNSLSDLYKSIGGWSIIETSHLLSPSAENL